MRLSRTSTGSVLVLLVVFTNIEAITQCTKDEESCGCKTEKGTISLKKYADSPFQDTDPITAFTYYWSPCKDIAKGVITASCVQEIGGNQHYDCGVHRTISTSVDSAGNAVFKMDAGDNKRHSFITCKCKANAVDLFHFEKEDPMIQGLYDMSLTGDSCCPKSGPAPSPGGGGGGGLSVGSILLIVLLVVVVVYLVGGVVLQTAVRKAEGKERIPNLSLWAAIPGLIRDGVRFTFSCGKSTHYDQI
ncbi:cation-dependent mannose-6-phosphate receptor [Elysia marginata]|uniref:Cation-dependent mannose-6-phosphate receptor n=1 Tax=Elysia marginata TaxID=1093978 RepID=A0AAV4HT81_9GAST|nr:cation-dependent mannose-6-phosphate receptor [Elysia marginata]